MALVGMRNMRDYRHRVRPDNQSAGLASPFNVKKESLTLANFSCAEIESLYGQHTADTAQSFTKDAVERAWDWTEGQSRLVRQRYCRQYPFTYSRFSRQFRRYLYRILRNIGVNMPNFYSPSVKFDVWETKPNGYFTESNGQARILRPFQLNLEPKS
jgi:hypothetical protein